MHKLLIIEDDPDQVALYETRLEMEGIEVQATMNGKDGLAMAREWQPDLILLDIKMEGMDGLEVLADLKNYDMTKQIPVVILTNVVKKDVFEQAKKLGAVDVWLKTDVLPSEVAKRSKELLAKTSAQ